jgi:hypothetical protein
MLACGLGPAGRGVQMDWSTVKDGTAVRKEMLDVAATLDNFIKNGLVTTWTHVPSLDGASSAALVASVGKTHESLLKTFRGRFEAKREEVRKNKSLSVKERVQQNIRIKADEASNLTSIKFGKTLLTRYAQALVGEQLAGLGQYDWVTRVGEVEKNVFETLLTDSQQTLATLAFMEDDDGAATVQDTVSLAQVTSAPETSQKSKKSGKGKKKKKSARSAEGSQQPAAAAPQETLPPIEDLSCETGV